MGTSGSPLSVELDSGAGPLAAKMLTKGFSVTESSTAAETVETTDV